MVVVMLGLQIPRKWSKVGEYETSGTVLLLGP